ncbi:hypothetical protein F946_01994 [Acinetobacter johnsonii ANC 3681]|uniref:Uncharacterized protein n=1 Tax=Acinetobacter johnsonii ANC 3681 TaxID=1217662 RepID=N9CPT4_ACIJO|nr:hypothetical protein [Acinetobacter johnsonii]ENV72519.1 hypothetical protein F946_01994 [Acinetobacter johnsonii ANC 3681]OOW15499.1 hypothetical protein MF4640_04410 [Acinetobacter sp. MF4640]WQE02660.1 hypothetical protein U0040_07085 [Acinetobacter johnsonii]
MEKALSLLIVSIKPLHCHSAVAFLWIKKLEGYLLDLLNPYKKEKSSFGVLGQRKCSLLIDEMYVMTER